MDRRPRDDSLSAGTCTSTTVPSLIATSSRGRKMPFSYLAGIVMVLPTLRTDVFAPIVAFGGHTIGYAHAAFSGKTRHAAQRRSTSRSADSTCLTGFEPKGREFESLSGRTAEVQVRRSQIPIRELLERVRFQLRAEALNAFNRHTFGGISTNPNVRRCDLGHRQSNDATRFANRFLVLDGRLGPIDYDHLGGQLFVLELQSESLSHRIEERRT
jgi:hypothetical protein